MPELYRIVHGRGRTIETRPEPDPKEAWREIFRGGALAANEGYAHETQGQADERRWRWEKDDVRRRKREITARAEELVPVPGCGFVQRKNRSLPRPNVRAGVKNQSEAVEAPAAGPTSKAHKRASTGRGVGGVRCPKCGDAFS